MYAPYLLPKPGAKNSFLVCVALHWTGLVLISIVGYRRSRIRECGEQAVLVVTASSGCTRTQK
ncbi:hypothetical protein BaRGS_00011632, partial [Batillaria attramentaria]